MIKLSFTVDGLKLKGKDKLNFCVPVTLKIP